METAVKKIDLVAVAAEVQTKFASMLESLIGLVEITNAAHSANNKIYYNACDLSKMSIEDYRAFKLAEADHELSWRLAKSVEQITHRLTSEGENIERGLSSRDGYLRRLESRVARDFNDRLKDDNEKKLETAEPIASDFYLIEAKTVQHGRGKYKQFKAKATFLVNGRVYEIEKLLGATGQLSDHCRERLGYRFLDRKATAEAEDDIWADLCKPEMSAEQLGKAVHFLKSIRAAFAALLAPTEAAAA
ncbi:hypothetical protein HFO91_30465 [Rhizobium leguminosarum]|uniref:hypothetical protein n=1 Tax=Rhizobium leguminosarum TaxID=384 RepID=UPI001C96D53B|nr:hypothetical protein [Rhizobium leguminosarum]MBY5453904.1 hypothetical protein [Rhizobium leguminosarum]